MNIPSEALFLIQFSLFVLPGYALLKGLGRTAKTGFEWYMNSFIAGAGFLMLVYLIPLGLPYASSTNVFGMLGYGLALSTFSFAVGWSINKYILEEYQTMKQLKAKNKNKLK